MISYKASDNVLVIELDFKDVHDKKYILFTSDEHIDSQYNQWSALKSDLDMITELDGGWCSIGDMFDVMGHSGDPRSSKSDVLKGLQESQYYNRVLEYVSDKIEPYKDRLLMVTEGNHEMNVKKRMEVDLLQALPYYIKQPALPLMPYSGWIVIKIKFPYRERAYSRIVMRYTHGISKTKFFKLNQMFVADVYIQGHIHQRRQEDMMMVSLNDKLYETYKECEFIQLSTYKQELHSEYSMRQGYAPAPIGGNLMEISYSVKNGLKKPIWNFRKCKH